MEDLVAVSFFSGALGLDLGLERAGIRCAAYSEIDGAARATIWKNRPMPALLGDIRNYSAEDIRKIVGGEVHVVCGGPPCQAFSTAGKRQGLDDERGNVFLKYLDLIADLGPKYVVIENVRGLMSAKKDEVKGGVLLHVVSFLKEHGYEVTFDLYNAANFGAPQIRERFVLVAVRDCNNTFRAQHLIPTHCDDPGYGLLPWVTFRQATAGIPRHDHVQFPARRLKYFRLLKEGQNWRDLPAEIQPEAMGKSFTSGGGKTGFFRRLAWDKPAPTLVTCPTMPATDLCHPEELRPLSVQEYKRLQGFPDEWIISGTLEQQYRQLGNAVPVQLGEAIGQCIQDHRQGTFRCFRMKKVEDERGTVYHRFAHSRYKRTSDTEWLEDHS